MLSKLKRDYVVNNKGKRVLLIMLIYRLGNKVYYSKYPFLLKKTILSLLNIANKLFIFYPLNIELPFSCKIGAGFRIVHQHGIVLNGGVEIGENCTIHHQVTIGINEFSVEKRAAKVGNNVYIGCGAKIIGNVKIEDGVKIGANAVVVKDLLKGTTAICRQEIING
ncbi:MAG TPA: serine acetyltransferase [Desulfosporosinus sp.]|jgi:serine O-acetyltransferase|nr:serine acetyltransferase [Desulfosporosinus sp.]